MSQIYNMYNILTLLYNIYSTSPSFSTVLKKDSISIPISFSIPYYMSYNSSNKKEETKNEISNLDHFQMDRLLKWMKLFFDEDFNTNDVHDTDDTNYNKEKEKEKETHKAFKKELYNIYCTISSDYSQYKQWTKYNNTIYILSSLRSKNTKDLANKINSDVELFNEGLKMYSLLFNSHHSHNH